jgi:hypothetical protein
VLGLPLADHRTSIAAADERQAGPPFASPAAGAATGEHHTAGRSALQQTQRGAFL